MIVVTSGVLFIVIFPLFPSLKLRNALKKHVRDVADINQEKHGFARRVVICRTFFQ